MKKVLCEVVDSHLNSQRLSHSRRRMGKQGTALDDIKECLRIPYTSPWCLDDFLTANVPEDKKQNRSFSRKRDRDDRRQQWEEFKSWVENNLLSKISENI